jgi:hypothetical protein
MGKKNKPLTNKVHSKLPMIPCGNRLPSTIAWFRPLALRLMISHDLPFSLGCGICDFNSIIRCRI